MGSEMPIQPVLVEHITTSDAKYKIPEIPRSDSNCTLI